MAAYTDATKIANHLGVALTVPQEAQAAVVADAITVWIDHRTGRTWQGASGAVADEIQPVQNVSGQMTVYLEQTPVVAITALETRPRSGVQPWTLLDPTEYEIADPAAGRIVLSASVNGNYDTRTDYTTSTTAPPADLAYAATVLSADVLFTMLHPESAGVEQLSIAQADISLRYATGEDAGRSSGAALALRIVLAYRRVVLA